MENISQKVIPIIKNTRNMLLPYFGKVDNVRYKNEYQYNVVTKLDEDVENYLRDKLKEIYPSIEFVGEEFGGNRNAERFWMVDPIDGTAHFIRGTPFCTTMLALVENGEVTFSVIYDFLNDIVYHTTKGEGAYKDSERIKVSERSISNSYIGWETHLDKPENMEKFMRLRKTSILFKTVCSGYEYVMVASGKLEARVCFDPHGKDYDFAPGSLLVQEAGGVVANIGKRTYDYRNTDFIAASKGVFKALTEGKDAIFPIY